MYGFVATTDGRIIDSESQDTEIDFTSLEELEALKDKLESEGAQAIVCMIIEDTCPVCGSAYEANVCPWEMYTQEDYIQAMTIYNGPGGECAPGWVHSVLAHEYHDSVMDIYTSSCVSDEPPF